MPRTGRPTKLTPSLSAAFCEQLGVGLSRTKASALVGVSKKAVFEWLRLGRRADSGPHAEFLAAVLAAEATFVAEQLSTVVRAATPRRARTTRTTTFADGRVVTVVTERVQADWRTAAWLLGCKDPGGYGGGRENMSRLRSEVAELRRAVSSATPPSPGAGRADHAGVVSVSRPPE